MLKNDSEKVNLFVYGTLKRGGALHRNIFAADAKFIGEEKLKGFKMVNYGWFPAAFQTHNEDDVIHGEVYEVSWDEIKKRFDRVEGYPSLYDRIETEKGIIYVMDEERALSGGKIIENGIWKINN